MGPPGALMQPAETAMPFLNTKTQRHLLFICTGNYYRSRYAELWFTARGAALAADWRAESRGFRLSSANVGPIAPCVLERLTARAVPHPPASRFPLQLREHDLLGA